MTREQVIKGLECCNTPNNHEDCPYNTGVHYNECTHKLLGDAIELIDDAIALIKAQQEELIQLRRANLQLKEWASDFVKGEGHEAD